MIRGHIHGPINNVPFLQSGASYLVDDYSPQAAYSMRLLSSTYVGSAIRVRRTSDSSEQDIGFSGDDFDTSSLATFCSGTTGVITTWYDQSGNGNDLTETTAANQATIYTGGATVAFGNGYAGSYDGSNDRLTGSGLGALNGGACSVFVAAQQNTSAVAPILEGRNGLGADRISFRLDVDGTSNSAFRVRNSGGTNYDAGNSTNLSTSTIYLQSFFMDASKNMSVFDNGATGGTNTYTGTFTNSNTRVGTNYNCSIW